MIAKFGFFFIMVCWYLDALLDHFNNVVATSTFSTTMLSCKMEYSDDHVIRQNKTWIHPKVSQMQFLHEGYCGSCTNLAHFLLL